MISGFLAMAAVAYGSACCTGTISDQPALLGRCEHFGVGLTVAEAYELGGTDATGRWRETSDTWAQTTATLGIGARWARWGSAAVAMPAVGTVKSAPGASSVGAGVGDLSVAARIEPWEESLGPTVGFTAGVVVPTGRPWSETRDPLGADVTGRGAWVPVLGVGLERTNTAWPWRLGAEAGGADTATFSASIGRSFDMKWTAAAGAYGRVESAGAGAAWRSGLDLRLVRGQPAAWRTWASLGFDLPVGASSHTEARLGLGFVIVR